MQFRITSGYGVLEEVRKGRHTGIDIAMPEGTPLKSIMNGTVEQIYNSGPIGNGVKIQTDDGREIIYGHMNNVTVKPGEHVDAGELIGLSGNTGNSTGPHLHFGMKEGGNFINPEEHIDKLEHMLGPVGRLIYNPIKDKVKESTKETIYGVLEGVLDVVLDSIGAITLVGSGILLIAKVCGFEKGNKYASLLFLANVLIKYFAGGYN